MESNDSNNDMNPSNMDIIVQDEESIFVIDSPIETIEIFDSPETSNHSQTSNYRDHFDRRIDVNEDVIEIVDSSDEDCCIVNGPKRMKMSKDNETRSLYKVKSESPTFNIKMEEMFDRITKQMLSQMDDNISKNMGQESKNDLSRDEQRFSLNQHDTGVPPGSGTSTPSTSVTGIETTKTQISQNFVYFSDDIGPTSPDDQGPTSPDDQGPASPDDQGPASPDDQEPTSPDDQGPASPDDQGPASPDDQGSVSPDDQDRSVLREKGTPSTSVRPGEERGTVCTSVSGDEITETQLSESFGIEEDSSPSSKSKYGTKKPEVSQIITSFSDDRRPASPDDKDEGVPPFGDTSPRSISEDTSKDVYRKIINIFGLNVNSSSDEDGKDGLNGPSRTSSPSHVSEKVDDNSSSHSSQSDEDGIDGLNSLSQTSSPSHIFEKLDGDIPSCSSQSDEDGRDSLNDISRTSSPSHIFEKLDDDISSHSSQPNADGRDSLNSPPLTSSPSHVSEKEDDNSSSHNSQSNEDRSRQIRYEIIDEDTSSDDDNAPPEYENSNNENTVNEDSVVDLTSDSKSDKSSQSSSDEESYSGSYSDSKSSTSSRQSSTSSTTIQPPKPIYEDVSDVEGSDQNEELIAQRAQVTQDHPYTNIFEDVSSDSPSCSSTLPKTSAKRKRKSKHKQRRNRRRQQSPVRETSQQFEEPPELLEERSICMFYMRGTCRRGNECKFSHVGMPKMRFELCKFFARGECAKGSQCEFMHSEYPCKFYYKDKTHCEQHNRCRFSHQGQLSEAVKDMFFGDHTICDPAPSDQDPPQSDQDKDKSNNNDDQSDQICIKKTDQF